MFDSLKSMGAIAGLLKNKEALRAAGDRVKEELARTRVVGESGGGLVRATVSGEMKVLDITMAPALVAGIGADDSNRALAGRYITDAVNDGLARARAEMQKIVSREAQAMGLPDIPGLGNLLQ